MGHQAFLQSLSAQDRAALTAKSGAKGAVHLTGHVALVVALAWAVIGPLGGWAMLPLGVALVFLFCPLHEASHGTVFARQGWNLWLARGLGLVLILPPLWFRYFHFAHHKHTHDPDRDPELQTPKPRTVGGYVWHISGLPLWISLLKTLVRNARGACDDAFVPVRARPAVRREARVMLSLYLGAALVSVASGSTGLLWLWLVPLVLGQPVLRLYLLAEHTFCPQSADMFENTRTTFTTRMVRWLAWNMPFHAEHHAFPTVPFHQLPNLHAMAARHLRSTADGYAAFHADYVRQIGGR